MESAIYEIRRYPSDGATLETKTPISATYSAKTLVHLRAMQPLIASP